MDKFWPELKAWLRSEQLLAQHRADFEATITRSFAAVVFSDVLDQMRKIESREFERSLTEAGY